MKNGKVTTIRIDRNWIVLRGRLDFYKLIDWQMVGHRRNEIENVWFRKFESTKKKDEKKQDERQN